MLRFGAGAMLGALLPTLGDPGLVRLATGMEVERMQRPSMGASSDDLIWRVELLRPGQAMPMMILGGHPLGMVQWQAPEDPIYFRSGGTAHVMTAFTIMPHTRPVR